MKRLGASLFALCLAATLHGQTLTPVTQAQLGGTNGANPLANLIQATDGNLYGVMPTGGANDYGNLFRLTPAGVYTDIYDCSASGTDCGTPVAILQLPDGNLWVVSETGGTGDCTNGLGCGNIASFTLGGSFIKDAYDFTATGSGGQFPINNVIYDITQDAIYGVTFGTSAGINATSGYSDPYGSVYKFITGVQSGISVMEASHHFNTTDSFGFQPVDGPTEVNGNIYFTMQVGGTGGYGTLGYIDAEALKNLTLLHYFGTGVDGSFPSAGPRFYGPTSEIYGATSDGVSGTTRVGSFYKAGLTSGFTTLGTLTGDPSNDPGFITGPQFDTAGNILMTAPYLGGGTSNGAIYIEKQAGGTPAQLYTFTDGSNLGDHPYPSVFFDQTGAMWTQQYGGGNLNGAEGYGTIDKWTLSTETKPPITISTSPVNVAPNTNFKITWTATNRFSQNEQQCYGFQSNFTGNNAFSGQQTGTYTQTTGILTGSQTISYGAVGDYPIAILCGWTQAATTVVHVRDASRTTITATPTSVSQGANVTFNVGVAGNGTAATGAVTLTLGSTTIGTVTLSNGAGQLTYATNSLTPGSYTVTASYPGDGQYAASTGTVTFTVTSGSTAVATTTTVVASPNSVAVGGTVKITATVKKQTGSGTPTGNVVLSVSGQVLGTVPLNGSGVASASEAANVPAGSYTVTAAYQGDTNDKASSGTATIAVKNSTTTSLTVNPTTVKSGSSTSVTVKVSSGSGTPTGSVTLYANGENLGGVNLGSGGTVTFPVSSSGYPTGTYTVTATYNGDSTHAASTSPGVAVKID